MKLKSYKMGKEFEIEKLNGHDNYHTWSFAMRNVIDYKGYSNCIKTVEKTECTVKIRVCAEKAELKQLACRVEL